MTFIDFVQRATGHSPYDFQTRLAEEGLPDLLEVPTGAGKTLAATLPWLYRRRAHPDAEVRDQTPHWLVIALPMRVLVEQTVGSIRHWLDNLALTADVGLYSVMGGEGRIDSAWRMQPQGDAIFVGTIDMLLSRAMNRGYGESRFSWPIDFGLFNSGTQWVFDEVQLMGPGLPTSRQLQGLRSKLGSAGISRSMWMSATVRREELSTVDAPDLGAVVELSPSDRAGPLARRLGAEKTVEHVVLEASSYGRSLARLLATRHRPGTLTIAVVNTVDRAVEVFGHLQSEAASEVETVLVHSRFRPIDRAHNVERALAAVESGTPGRIVISTQVLEAGVDISATTLFTEAAPWPSVVQRAGRCNRDGAAADAVLLWAKAPKSAPYEDEDVEAAAGALSSLAGRSITPDAVAGLDVAVILPVHPVLRRRDLLELFDTAPDLSGNDIDVSRFIRAADDLDLAVAWWALNRGVPERVAPMPRRDERCAVPVSQMRDELRVRGDRRAYRFDHLKEEWVICRAADLRPGLVLILDADEGGYDEELGWSPKSKAPVRDVSAHGDDADPVSEEDLATGADPLSERRRCWLALEQHLDDVQKEVANLAGELDVSGLQSGHLEAAVMAGRLHDVGKAHAEFQGMLHSCAQDDEEEAAARAAGTPLAKSGGSGRGRHERRYFRHELVSALALLNEGSAALEKVKEADLVVYLVASHHGRVRLGFRSLPEERLPDEFPSGTPIALGVVQGEKLDRVRVPGGEVPRSTMDLSVMGLGAPEGSRSWSERALALRDRPDLGPFRLGFLEALVRVSDWRASAAADERGT